MITHDLNTPMNEIQRKGLFAEAKALLQRAQELLLIARAKHKAIIVKRKLPHEHVD